MMYTAAPLLFVLLMALCQAVPDVDLKDCRCAEGWTLLGQKCLKYVDKLVKWNQAKGQCEALGATLAMPKTKEENEFLAHIRNSNGGGSVWIGLKNRRIGDHGDGGQFWVDGTKAYRAKFPPGSSNNGYIVVHHAHHTSAAYTAYIPEDCFHMSAKKYNDAWNDNRCHRKMDFVCEKKISPENMCTCPQGWQFFGSKCYQYQHKNSWDRAKSTCTRYGSKIAEPKTKEENEFLGYIRNTKGGHALWIGLRRDIEYINNSNHWITRWQDKTRLGFRPNHSNIVNNHAHEHCFHINHKKYGLAWNAINCDEKWGFVCEKDFISAR